MPERLAESTQISVYLAYGWFAPDASSVDQRTYEKNAIRIGDTICDCLRGHDLDVDWDGDLSRKICVSLNWQRRDTLN